MPHLKLVEEPKAKKSYTVVLVEDDDVQREVVSSTLIQFGYKVEACATAFEAVDVIQRVPADVMLTDYYMPNMNGLALVSEIKRIGIDLPIVFMTARPDINMAFNAVSDGIMDVVEKDEKNVYLSVIGHVLGASIEKHRAREESKALEAAVANEHKIAHETVNQLDQPIAVVLENDDVDFINQAFIRLLPIPSQFSQKYLSVESLCELLIQGSTFKVFGSEQELSKRELLSTDNSIERLLISKNEHAIYKIRCYELENASRVITLFNVTRQVDKVENFVKIIEQIPAAVILVDASKNITLSNKHASHMLKLPPQTEVTLSSLFDDQMLLLLHREMFVAGSVLDRGRSFRIPDSKIRRIDSEILHTDLTISKVTLANDEPHYIFHIFDASYRVKQEEKVMKADLILQSAVINMPFCMLVLDLNGNIRGSSDSSKYLVGFRTEELNSKSVVSLFSPSEANRFYNDTLGNETNQYHGIFETFASNIGKKSTFSCELELVTKYNQFVNSYASLSKHVDSDGHLIGYIMSLHDYTEQKKAISYINHIAQHDELTGLPNRSTLRDRIDLALKRVKRFGKKLALLHIDLDAFKRINDSVGHRLGDQIIQTISDRIVKVVRETDSVSRVGGDEFVVLLTDLDDISDIEHEIQMIQKSIAEPIPLNRMTIRLTSTVGVVVAPDQGSQMDDVLRKADIAVHTAKETNRGRYLVFDQDIRDFNDHTLSLEHDLFEALDNNEFEVFYQPKVCPRKRKVRGFEALIRWHHPEQGFISPARFIPLAESSGLIDKLGLWVFSQAISDIAKLVELHGKPYTISVNVSPRQLENENFLDQLKEIVRGTTLSPKQIEIEITENLLMKGSSDTLKILEDIERLGLKISLDDFGVGYSSLAYLSQYPIHVIKVDRGFMNLDNPANVAIVSAICGIAKGLGLMVVAEGVESEEQLTFVTEMSCDLVQGFYYARPMRFDDLGDCIKSIEQ